MNEIRKLKSNRKLHCHGEWVNLDYILDLIQGGEDFRVRRSQDEKDITRETAVAAINKLLKEHATLDELKHFGKFFLNKRRKLAIDKAAKI
jgi:polyhydroxyalkanoate synthesis regulator protein